MPSGFSSVVYLVCLTLPHLARHMHRRDSQLIDSLCLLFICFVAVAVAVVVVVVVVVC